MTVLPNSTVVALRSPILSRIQNSQVEQGCRELGYYSARYDLPRSLSWRSNTWCGRFIRRTSENITSIARGIARGCRTWCGPSRPAGSPTSARNQRSGRFRPRRAPGPDCVVASSHRLEEAMHSDPTTPQGPTCVRRQPVSPDWARQGRVCNICVAQNALTPSGPVAGRPHRFARPCVSNRMNRDECN